MYEPKVGERVIVVRLHRGDTDIHRGTVIGIDSETVALSFFGIFGPSVSAISLSQVASIHPLPVKPPSRVMLAIKSLISRAVTTAVVTATAGGVYALGKYHTEIAAVVGWLFDMVTQ